ncbi:hypothetical protein LEMLEM_LOCUS19217 [Lemmus lemmus]
MREQDVAERPRTPYGRKVSWSGAQGSFALCAPPLPRESWNADSEKGIPARTMLVWAGEVTQQLRTLAVFQRTQVQFPAPTWQLTAVCNSVPGDLTPPIDICAGKEGSCRSYQGVWTMHGKTNKASEKRRLPDQRIRKHGLEKKKALLPPELPASHLADSAGLSSHKAEEPRPERCEAAAAGEEIRHHTECLSPSSRGLVHL